jgi:hypothetical protein
MRSCELCGTMRTDNMRCAKRATCFQCIDRVIEFAITAGMELNKSDS